jgi:hypothetical protein
LHRSLPGNADGEAPVDDVLMPALDAERGADAPPLDSAFRSVRLRRNQICIGIIALGLANYLVYTLSYAALGGDAANGYRTVVTRENGKHATEYYVRGHFIHTLSGRERLVSRGAWIYSYVHSISVPLTSGAMIISMLVLARPHILATMRGGLVGGQTFVVAFGTIVSLVALAVTAMFTWNFVEALCSP